MKRCKDRHMYYDSSHLKANKHSIFHLTDYKAQLSSLTCQFDKVIYITLYWSEKCRYLGRITLQQLPDLMSDWYNVFSEIAAQLWVKLNCLPNNSNLQSMSFQ